MLFAYIGPETMMPVTSVIVGVVGVFMMFGRTSSGSAAASSAASGPVRSRKKVAKPNPEGAGRALISATTAVEMRIPPRGRSHQEESSSSAWTG